MPLEANKRIAKNTLLLYIRQIVTVIVSLFTVRIVLKTLGVVDYGIYNVVGSIVTMFSFISNTMGAATQRFLAFELGKRDFEELNKVFNLTLIAYIFIVFIILILSETVGLWFLNIKMNIPDNRIEAAQWVYQFSIISFIIKTLTIPYTSLIIVRERMNVYAYISIFDAILKLFVVYLLVLINIDKLKLFSILMFVIYFFDTLFYILYCKKNFEESKFVFWGDINKIKEIFSFAWWNIIGSFANIAKSQGVNILLNIFFGPTVNAARGVSFQIRNNISNFNNNFFMAVRPRIIKEYAKGDYSSMLHLMFQSTKMSFFLMSILTFPILFETDFFLHLWLGQTPLYVVVFTRLIIIDLLFDALTLPIASVVQAKGEIRNYQLLVSGFILLNLPFSYLFLKLSYPPSIVFLVSIGISFISYLLRLFFIRKLLSVSLKEYFMQVLVKIIAIIIISIPLPYFIINSFNEGIIRTILSTSVVISLLFLTILFVGLSSKERKFLYSLIKK